MVLSKKVLLITSLSLIFSIYGFFLTGYFIDLTIEGDTMKYIGLWNNLEKFQLDSIGKICCNRNSLVAINAENIGSFQLIYPLFVNYFSKIINFQQFASVTSGIYSFLLSFVFLYKKKFSLRLLFIIPIFLGIYTFGIYSVLDRLKISLIFYLFALMPNLDKKIRNLLLFFSIFTHSSILLISVPTLVKINFSPGKSPLMSYLSTRFKIIKLSRLSLSNFLLSILIISFFILIFNLTFDKFEAWLPVILNYFNLKNILLILERSIDVLFTFILMYPNFKYNQYPKLIHILSILPIVLTTFLIGGFRTLILTYLYFAVSNWQPTKKSNFSYLQTLFFILMTINCIRNGSLFISKLQLTGFGY